RRSTRDDTCRDACAGGQPVRDVEETSERGEHLDRLDDTVGGRVPEGMKRRPSVTGRWRMLASRWRIGPSLLAANAMARTGRRTPAALAPYETIRENDQELQRRPKLASKPT